MDYFYVLTMRFQVDDYTHERSEADVIRSREGDTAEDLFWRAHQDFRLKYRCDSPCKVLHWSLTKNELS